MPFFSDTGLGGFEPKRNFRFLINFTELSNLTFMATKAAKPSYEMTPKDHQVLNHVFKFPGIIKWSDVQVTFVDAMDPNVGSKFYNALRNAGYVNPISEGALVTGVTKVQSTRALGEVKIKQLNGGGVVLPAGLDPGDAIGAIDATRYIEEWTLKNAFIKSVKWGELSYESDDLVNVTVDITYDYATYISSPSGVPLPGL